MQIRGKILRIYKNLLIFFTTICLTIFVLQLYDNDHDRDKGYTEGLSFDGNTETNYAISKDIKIDYHDYDQIELDKKRKGLGEQGEAADFSDIPKDLLFKLYKVNGYNGALSDLVSLHRALPDVRPPNCYKIFYKQNLPTASIIIPFHNEHFSVLLRTAFSVIQRSPNHLVKEIILVDDGSTKEFLKFKLELYLAEHIPKAKIIRLKKRSGLIVARQTGAKVAKGEVLIFLDAHCEANVNWMPPLLEIISDDYKTCVCPFIDAIDYDNYEYVGAVGGRGAFNWDLGYRMFNKFKRYKDSNSIEPFASPVMAGGLFAISAKFFWELGGYDEGLFIWGGEQFELSFKVWQCGGRLLDVPCSRVGHMYRKFGAFENPNNTIDYLCTNYRRVVEVWMDEYKEYYYMRHPDCAKMTFGDISKQKAIRNKLSCKSFKWYMEEVAYDVPYRYPMIEPSDIAYGELRNDGNSDFCMETTDKDVGLNLCTAGSWPQVIQFTWRGEIKHEHSENCWDIDPTKHDIIALKLHECHFGAGNQLWVYDEILKIIRHGNTDNCLDIDADKVSAFLAPCDKNKYTQKWSFQNFNKTQQNKVKDYLTHLDIEEKI